MKRLLSKSFTENPKPVLSHAEGSAIRSRKWAGLFAMVVALVVSGTVATAQQAKKIPRIGYLSSVD